jgi:hypothetical protein
MRTSLAAIVVASLALLSCTATTPAADLKVGDCVNLVSTVDANGDNVVGNSVVDCSQSHDEQVFSVFEYPNATSAFPGYEHIGEVEQGRCQSDFEDYVGVTWEESSYTISYSSPDERGWASGDHTIHCMLADAAGAKLTGSAQGSER